MNLEELAEEFERLGWEVSEADWQERLAVCQRSDRNVSVIIGISEMLGRERLTMLPAVESRALADACSMIDPGYAQSSPYQKDRGFIEVSVPEFLEQHVRHASEKAIAWAERQDLDDAIAEYAVPSADSRREFPIWHLAALALAGDSHRLNAYLKSFDAGQTARFSPFHKKGPHRPSARTCQKPNATAVATAVNVVPLAWRLADDYEQVGWSRPRVCAFPRLGSLRAFF